MHSYQARFDGPRALHGLGQACAASLMRDSLDQFDRGKPGLAAFARALDGKKTPAPVRSPRAVRVMRSTASASTGVKAVFKSQVENLPAATRRGSAPKASTNKPRHRCGQRLTRV